MSESLWKSDVMEEELPEEPRIEPAAEKASESAAESGAVTLSVNEFAALEERIQRTVNLVKFERQARATAEERVIAAEAQISKQAPLVDRLQAELQTLRTERGHLRQRVERILSQLDALEL